MQRNVIFLVVSALLAGAMAACSGGNSTSTSTTTTAASPAAPAKMKTATKAASTSNGQSVFTTNCASCHQANGMGSVGPPLEKNDVVTGAPAKVIHIVKNGLTGAIKVNGKSYNGNMPAWKGTLSNADIAAVITYIRSAWGNKASAVTTAQVASTP